MDARVSWPRFEPTTCPHDRLWTPMMSSENRMTVEIRMGS